MHSLVATSESVAKTVKRNEQFKLENFLQGGVEGVSMHLTQGVSNLDDQYDFGQIDHKISCEDDLQTHGYQYIIWDNNHNTAMSSGWYSAFQYGTYSDPILIRYPGDNAPDAGQREIY